MPDSIAIVSGGMDSVTLLHHLVKVEKRHPAVITFAYGQKHDKEVAFAKAHAETLECKPFQLLDLSAFAPLFASSSLVSEQLDIPNIEAVLGDPQPSTYVPNRNMMFLALTAAWAETLQVSDIYYGAQRHDIYGYWDTTPQFLAHINAIFSLNRKMPIHIHAPFINESKTDILQRGLTMGVNYAQTWSCYEGNLKACGTCPTCAERLKAFADLQMIDPVPYMLLGN